MKKIKLLIVLVMIINMYASGQEIIDPVEIPYFVIDRKSPNVVLPKTLGGKAVKGFARIMITLDSSGKLLRTEVKKLKLTGKVNLSYQLGQEKKTFTIRKYETFLKKCVAQIRIVKTDNRKTPLINNITFIIRFK
jgi:hypothetical protein